MRPTLIRASLAALLAVLCGWAAPGRAPAPPMEVGMAGVESEAQVGTVSDHLATVFGAPAAPVAARLRRMRAAPGAGLYLHVRQSAPSRLVLVPAADDQVSIDVQAQLAVGVKSGGAGEGGVAVVWIKEGSLPEYRVKTPAAVTHLTLVVNGREVAGLRPVRLDRGEVSIPLR